MTKDTLRLNKYIAQCGVASRRGADALIQNGRVTVNGNKVESAGLQVDPASDKVAVDGEEIALADTGDLVIMLHKPIETVTTSSDPQGRTTVMDLLPSAITSKRPFTVGRLDYFSEGLLLITTNGELCNRMTHPKWHLPKVYEVRLRGELKNEHIQEMQNGMTLPEGEKLAPVKVRRLGAQQKIHTIEMTLIQGVNRQIRRMMDVFGLTILQLKRVRQGPLLLGNLPVGKFRDLTEEEIKSLKQQLKFT